MVEIDDVLNEITMIRRVHEDQARVWEDMHKNPTLSFACRCHSTNFPHIKRLYRITTRLEEDALKVRESASLFIFCSSPQGHTHSILAW